MTQPHLKDELKGWHQLIQTINLPPPSSPVPAMLSASDIMYSQHLPNEIWEEILHYAHTNMAHFGEFVQLRLVSYQLDYLVSRIALQRGSFFVLEKDRFAVKIAVKKYERRKEITRPSFQWMLRTKAQLCRNDILGPFAFIHDAVSTLTADRAAASDCRSKYLHAACSAISATQYSPLLTGMMYESRFSPWSLPHKLQLYQSGTICKITALGAQREEIRNFYGLFHLASACGDVAYMEVLIGEKVDPRSGHHLFGDPMHVAIMNDQLGAVRVLLKHGIDRVPIKNGETRSVFIFAVECKSKRVVDFLLRFPETRVNDICPSTESTALTCAVKYGWTDTVNTMLRRPDMDRNYSCEWHINPIDVAIEGDHLEIVQALIEHGDYESRVQSPYNFNLLWQTLQLDRGAILALLLDRYRPDTDMIFPGSKPMLQMAIGLAAKNSVKVLLERTNPQLSDILMLLEAVVDKDDNLLLQSLLQTPKAREATMPQIHITLSEAAKRSMVNVVRALLECDYVDPNCPALKQPPLFHSVEINHEQIFLLLLARQDLDVNVEFPGGPMVKYLVQKDDSRKLKQVINHPSIDTNRPSKAYTGTLLTYHRENIGHQPFEPRWVYKVPETSETPLMMAVKWYRPAAVSVLMQDPQIDTHVTDSFHRTPLWWSLWWACYYNDGDSEKMFETLLTSSTEAINTRDQDGWAPLHIAANENSQKQMNRLLSQPNIDPNVATNEGWTALHLATANCSQEVVDAILGHPRTNAKMKLQDGRTALDLHSDCPCGRLRFPDGATVAPFEVPQQVTNRKRDRLKDKLRKVTRR